MSEFCKSPGGHFAAFLFFFLGTTPAFSAVDDHPDKGVGTDFIMKCEALPGFSKDYCQCVSQVSQTIPENNPVLNLFLENARNPIEAKTAYRALIDGETYNTHNFSGINEKRDFVEGKTRVFVHRIESRCGNLD